MKEEAATLCAMRAYAVGITTLQDIPDVKFGVISAFPRADGSLWVIAPIIREEEW